MRGTIPLFWEQKQHGLTCEINLLRSEPLTKPVLIKHFEQLIAEYNKVLVINLVKKHMPQEHLLTKSLIKIF